MVIHCRRLLRREQMLIFRQALELESDYWTFLLLHKFLLFNSCIEFFIRENI
jgi:hypothetical protein